MRTLLISYDLAQPTLNKHALASAIMSLGASWARPLEHTWYVRSDRSEKTVKDRLDGLLNDNDGLLVQSVADEAALSNTQLRWFRQRQPQLDLDDGVIKTSTADIQNDNIVAFPQAATTTTSPGNLALAEAC